MKTILFLGLALASLAPAQAQTFRSHSFGSRGGWHGGGHNNHYYSSYRHYNSGPWWGVRFGGYYNAPVYYSDYGYTGYGYDTGYAGYYASQPNYQATGTWLGALAGAIIGRNSGSLGHNAWRGAAYGAGLGYIFGTVAENNVRVRQAEAARAPVVSAVTAPATPTAAAPAQPVTIINNYYNAPATPMSSANGLFGR